MINTWHHTYNKCLKLEQILILIDNVDGYKATQMQIPLFLQQDSENSFEELGVTVSSFILCLKINK